jgi:transcriptional regulator with GAF, ATPase, and Fis domain
VRLICATNRDLEAMALTGAFRDDLFYRLSVMTLDLPPLRSYKDNLETLANVFLEQSAASHGKRAPRLGTAVPI